MKRLTITVALALAAALWTGTQAGAVRADPPEHSNGNPAGQHTAKPSHPVVHHMVTREPAGRPVQPKAEHPVEPRHDSVRPQPERARVEPTETKHREDVRENRTRQVIHRPVVLWERVSQPVVAFAGRTRVEARAVAVSPSHVIVSLPSGALKTFVAFREGDRDRDRVTFRDRDRVRTFRVIEVSQPVAHRIVVFANQEVLAPQPELTVLRAVAPTEDELMLVQPNSGLLPVALTAVQPLPFGQVALLANDMVPPAFVPADVTFVGQPISVIGDLVTFMLPDGTTRTLVDTGPLPPIGSQVFVVENGSQVVSFSPAVTNFVGQVVAASPPFVTFALPNGSLRTLTVVEPVVQTIPVPGTRAMVFENGDRIARIQVL